MEPRIRYAKTKDRVSIAFALLGEGPPIVVVPSLFSNVRLLMSGGAGDSSPNSSIGVVQLLAKLGRMVVTFDSRCMGSSDRAIPDCSLEGRVADLEAVVDELALERFDLHGGIHGAATATVYAAHCPERVSHLALVNPYTRGEDYYARTPATRAIKALAAVAEDAWEFFTLTVANAVLEFKESERAARMAAMYRDSMAAADYVRFAEESAHTDISAILGQMSVRTIVVEDRNQFGAALELARPFASQIKGAEYVVVRGNEEAVRAIDSFLGPVPGREASDRASGNTGPVTVLFTDLVGHTEMMSRLGDDRGRDVLREHERITREVLKANGGTEVKTMGDGFMASFGSVTKAVECAIALQRAFDAWNRDPRPSTLDPLSVRVGLNAGEPIEEDGDLFGATVILASRIAAKANGGEILVADTVRGLCSGKGFLFADRGEFVAKGFEEPVRVYEVSWREDA